MSLLNKNFEMYQHVRIEEFEDNPKLNGKTGTVVGFESKFGRFGMDHFYIVLLDSPLIGIQWRAFTIHECFLKQHKL